VRKVFIRWSWLFSFLFLEFFFPFSLKLRGDGCLAAAKFIFLSTGTFLISCPSFFLVKGLKESPFFS